MSQAPRIHVVVWLSLAAVCAGAQAQSFEPVVLAGDPAPATGGGKFHAFGQLSLNDRSEIAFNALVESGQTEGGVFVVTKRGIEPIVVAGQRAPGTGGVFAGSASPRIAADGSVLFYGYLKGGQRRSGLFLHSAGELTPVALEHDVVPGTGLHLIAFRDHAMNSRGDVVFSAATFIPEHGPTQAIFTVRGGVVSPVVLPGDERPDGVRIFMPDAPSLNDDGEIFFVDRRPSGPRGMTRADEALVWSGGELSIAPRRGGRAARAAKALSPLDIGQAARNGNDEIAFIARLGGEHGAEGIFISR